MQNVKKPKLTILLTAGVLLASVGTTSGHEGDPQTEWTLASAYVGEPLSVGSPNAAGAIDAIVQAAAEMPNEFGDWLLPPHTTVDSVQWVDNVLEIELTLSPPIDDWCLSDTDIESLSRGLASPFMGDPAFGGTRTHLRASQDEPYGTLEQFRMERVGPAPVEETTPDGLAPPGEPQPQGAGVAPAHGPTQQAARQPAGALTGVTVYASAGHGWTAGDSSWYLQRPVLLEMCEDYGNIDMLNYFVHYAFNAGATVVPFRPVGWQIIEIVLDNDDPGVTYVGTWDDGTASKYYENGVTNSGIKYKWASASTSETHTARFTPNITVTDFYPVYCFAIASTNRTMQTYRVSHSGGITEIAIDHREVGNGWIWLGDYYLEAGGDNYVEITNESSLSGVVIADAIRWGHGWGDIVRPGPDTISGYPRDEECQRYWAQSELDNNAEGFDPDIWDGGGDDGSDNVRTGGKWAREMNQVPAGGVEVDRWKRIHLEFHTNAYNGNARGQICLITDLGATINQVEYAETLSDEVDADMLIMDEEFEHTWFDRASPTLTGSYGAICTGANGDEFDATIVELAFHDNQTDAELLRDDRVRAAMARACVHGITRFLNSLSDGQVPLAFAPDTPRQVRSDIALNGDVTIAWQAPLSDGARGDPATGYVVYQSGNGYGFGNPLVLGDVLSTTITDMAPGETRYFRVAATNDAGESMPSEVLAVRRPLVQDENTKRALIVNGFDRLRRQINPIQTFTQPPDYAGLSIERQIWRRSNSFDYVVQHAQAIALMDRDVEFASCANEAVIGSAVDLGNFDAVVWILGTESTEDETLDIVEQNKLTDYLHTGGGLFVSGAEIGWDLVAQGGGVSFMQDMLGADYVGDDADTYEATGAVGSILSDVGPFDLDPDNGAPYDTRTPDVLTPGTDAQACLDYVGGSGGVAGVQYEGGAHRAVTFGFPFEAITSPTARAEIMDAVLEFVLFPPPPRDFDYDHDGDVDMDDFDMFRWCYWGPEFYFPETNPCVDVQGEEDEDIDLEDVAVFQRAYTGPL